MPFGVPRHALSDMEIEGYHVPKGTTVLACLYDVMRDPKFFEEPDDFNPERFIDSGEIQRPI